jgi:hypothetical protein
MNCQHENIEQKFVEKEFAGEKFRRKTSVCKNCGAFLRDKEYELAFLGWLQDVYKKDRNKFQVQCHLDTGLVTVADKFLAEYPGVSQSHLFRSLVVVYLDHIDSDVQLSATFDSLIDFKILDSFTRKLEKKRVNIQFKPKMLVELEAMADAVDGRPAVLVEAAVVKMMSAITSQNSALKDFWEAEVMKYLDPILKAA